ncbi:hypothetical protein K443DRAFT_48128, partial [Laccaria amethystina LaAM-08-1]
MPATRQSKAIKTPEFIKSDTEDSNGSGDYGDKDNGNTGDSEVSEGEAIEY